MPGVKGKSGGPRANAGGARPGAGRPRKAKPEGPPPPARADDPVEFLMGVMNDPLQDPKLRVRAAIAAAAYKAPRFAPVAKKEQRNAAASNPSRPNRFATPSAPPRLVVNKS